MTDTSNNGVDARHASETTEHHTPDFIIEPARFSMGQIDLDPASCAAAQARVRARHCFTKADNGFTRPWHGRVFLNPPGGHCDTQGREVHKATKTRPSCTVTGLCGLPAGHTHNACDSAQKSWWFKLMREVRNGTVDAAIFVCFSIELLQSTQVDTPDGLDIPLRFPMCFPRRRVAYVKPDGAVGVQPPHASCVILVPPEIDRGGAEYVRRFRQAFDEIGTIVVPS